MNLYDNQNFIPMLLEETKEPFNDPEYIYELKFDGIRTLIFAEPKKIIIRNKRNEIINNRYPELLNIKNIVKKKVIFDGEIVTMLDGKPNFEKLKERALLKNEIKIAFHAKNNPVVFIAYDILYENKNLTELTLTERKKILEKYNNTDNFIKSVVFDTDGKDLYKIIVKEGLEGIVAKKKNSKYFINKRSKDWFKIKNLKEEDLYICGYKDDNNVMASLLLARKKKDILEFVGTVNIGKRNPEFLLIKKMPIDKKPLVVKDDYINIIPNLECTVYFLEKTKNDKMRQPYYKSLRY